MLTRRYTLLANISGVASRGKHITVRRLPPAQVTPLRRTLSTAATPNIPAANRPTPVASPTKNLDGSSIKINPPQPKPSPPSGSFWNLILFALGATAVFGLVDYFWVRSGSKDRLKERVGLPLEILELMKEARETTERAQEEKEKFESIVRRKREEKRRQERIEEQSDTDSVVVQAPTQNDVPTPIITTPEEAAALLLTTTPSLLEAERLYRQILQKLHFQGIELRQLHALVAEGTPTEEMKSIGQTIDAATRQRVQSQIDAILDAPETNSVAKDKRLLPYVLHLLALNLQQQGEVLKEHDEMATNFSSVSMRPIKDSLASQKFVAAESFYLQSLTLYRHHFQFDIRPYSVRVLNNLGTLYTDMGELIQAEAVWIKCLDLLQAARKSRVGTKSINNKVKGKENSKSDDELSEVTEVTSMSLPASYTELSSEICERLGMIHSMRGEYAQAVTWIHEALKEWDSYGVQVRKSSTTPSLRSSNPSLSPSTTVISTPIEAAVSTLPRALHLLISLSANLYQAQKPAEAYETNLQAMEVLERIMNLVRIASGEKSIDATRMVNGHAKHSQFLSTDYTDALMDFLHQQSSSTTPTLLSSLAEESAAAYFNLAILLKSLNQRDDAKRAMKQAKEMAKIGARQT